jgi:cytokinin dehydrogenase
VRAFYDDFGTFTKDQELLVSMPDLVDYAEGFIVLNEQSLHSASVAFPANVDFSPDFGTKRNPKIYYCIEFAIHDYQRKNTNVEQVSSKAVLCLSYSGLVKSVQNVSRIGTILNRNFY